MEIDTEGPVVINAVAVSEAVGAAGCGAVRGYRIEGQVNSDYVLLGDGTTIGARRVHVFPKVTVWKVRLTILGTEGGKAAAIGEVGLYCK